MSDPSDPYRRQPTSISPEQERGWGMTAHLVPLAAMILSAGLLGFIASIVIYLLYKDRGPFVRQNAANSVNIQVWMFVLVVISFVLMFVLIGFVTYVLVMIWAIVVHIKGAMYANRGEWYTPILVPRIVR